MRKLAAWGHVFPSIYDKYPGLEDQNFGDGCPDYPDWIQF